MNLSYKLTYFNITGLGEPVRMLLSYGGVDFEDFRFGFDEWPEYKPKMPMEQVPIFEINGKIYHQTRAFSRYFAKKLKLYGNDDFEDIEIDAIIDDSDDWRMSVVKYIVEDDPIQKSKLKSQVYEKTGFFLGKFEERIKKNGGYFVNNKLTWADIHITGIQEVLCNLMEKDFLQDFPELEKLNKTVRSIQKIKAYLDKRPKTEF